MMLTIIAALAAPHAVDVGARLGYARPVGAFDAGTHAADTSSGGIPLALDATVRLPGSSTWSVSAGGYFSYAPTIPKLCPTFDDCVASIGSDVELLALARVRAPRIAFVLPEMEIGTGWSWSSRTLSDHGIESVRAWSGPVIARVAVVPTVALGARTRLGLVLGVSLARSATFALDAPGLSQRGLEGARLHGTLDVGLRFGLDVL